LQRIPVAPRHPQQPATSAGQIRFLNLKRKEKKKELPPSPMAARNSRFAAARRQDSNNSAAAGLFARLLMAKSLSGRTAQHGESWDRIP
jgi:hypothetical protein